MRISHLNRPRRRPALLALVVVLVATPAAGCRLPAAQIIGQIYIDALKVNGFVVTDQLNSGTRERYIPALKSGDIDPALANRYPARCTSSTPRTSALTSGGRLSTRHCRRCRAEALDALPAASLDAAEAGYQPWERIVKVQLPLAVPVLIASIRVVSVTTSRWCRWGRSSASAGSASRSPRDTAAITRRRSSPASSRRSCWRWCST